MLDHVFTDAIAALSQSLERSLLERLAVEEHLHVDVLLGDLSWETSYGLLGETEPAKVRADLTMLWTTWSQSAFRDWYLGDGFSDSPRIDIDVTLRIQRLTDTPEMSTLLDACPDEGPDLGGARLHRAGPTVEHTHSRDLSESAMAFEVAYTGTLELDEEMLEDGEKLDALFSHLGGWAAAALVRLNDLPLAFLPDEVPDDF